MNTQNTLDLSLQNTQSLLSDFINSNDITDNLVTIFGDNFAIDTGNSLLESLANGDITVPISILSSSQINNANGAYSASNNTIYLATELIDSGDVDAITRTLLEETGHYLDAQININDAPGDEGAIFASIVLGEEIDREQLALLKAEDDTATIEIDGETRTIEQDGTTIYVNANASGNENGTSWANAYTDLQDALAAATPGDEVWVADGTYKPTTDDNRNIYFQIPTGVAVYGGFAGGETALFERDWLNNPTILSGDIGQEGVVTDNSGNVVNISGTTVTTILDGFTVSDGNTTNSGGGIVANGNANATLKNLIVRDNNALYGGGLSAVDSNPNLTNVTFIDNFASASGGAISIFVSRGSLIAENVVFISNEAQSGGAIYGGTGNNITNSTFYNNQAAEGSAISGGNTSTTIENSIFWNNLAAEEDSQIVTQGEVKNSIVEGGYTGTGTNIIDADPLFLDPENNDFRLQANSPGVDAGNNDVVNSTRDVLNNPRLFNNTVDLGAYEYSLLMSIDNATIVEGDSDTTNLQFNVTLLDSLGEASTEEVTVNYATVDNTAVAGVDYTPIEGTLTFNAGDTSQTINVPITGDQVIENDETLIVELSNISSNAVIIDQRAAGIITNDDEAKEISIADATIDEGKPGENAIEFTLSLNETYVENITVNYNIVEDTATADEDYTDINGLVTFEAGQKEQTISVTVQGDTDIEPDETFFVQLSNPSENATLGDDRATGIITNDDEETTPPPEPIPLTQTIKRFQNSDIPGTYLFAGEEESSNIRENFNNFEEEGTAFKVAFEPGEDDDLIPLYRFQSTRNPGTYLFAGEEERQNINENFSNDFNEEGLAFYVYGVGAEKGTTFYRFQNEDKPGTYLFAGPEERENILENFPNFTEEGAAFEVGI